MAAIVFRTFDACDMGPFMTPKHMDRLKYFPPPASNVKSEVKTLVWMEPFVLGSGTHGQQTPVASHELESKWVEVFFSRQFGDFFRFLFPLYLQHLEAITFLFTWYLHNFAAKTCQITKGVYRVLLILCGVCNICKLEHVTLHGSCILRG